jgi:hypothetical protein
MQHVIANDPDKASLPVNRLERQAGKLARAVLRGGGDGDTASLPDRPLVPRFRHSQRLTPGVDMIDIANGCAKRTYKSDFWRNRCVNHHYFLICTQGKS